ncbi:MAG TPA: phosphoribosyltransferase family protein [Terriglobales bacterium]|nr:phosphoribosyltransferase family protein [Terriglobales bacterium]
MQKQIIFRDREDAGHQLAPKLLPLAALRPIVYALPRGGVPIAYEIAHSLDAPLDVVIVRKLRHPLSPELAIGAIAEAAEDHPFLEPNTVAMADVSARYVEQEIAYQRGEIDRRRKLYADGRRLIRARDRVAILVDDGAATGSTMIAAIRAMRLQKPSQVIVAVPVASTNAFKALKAEADDIVCLQVSANFYGVAQFYHHFMPVEDRTVVTLLMNGLAFGAGDQPVNYHS